MMNLICNALFITKNLRITIKALETLLKVNKINDNQVMLEIVITLLDFFVVMLIGLFLQ